MAGIGRLKNKISPDEEKKEKKPIPLSDLETEKPSFSESSEEPQEKQAAPAEKAPIVPSSEREAFKRPEKIQKETPAPVERILPSRWNQPRESIPSTEDREKETLPPLSARDQLYQKITAQSEEEKNERGQFIARIMGKKVEKEKDSSVPEENVILQPVPQGPSRAEKIFVRFLIVLLIASLGFLIYLVIRGYLI
jgi:hypothetical protein